MFRKRHGLSEDELAGLVGQRSGRAIRWFEAGDRWPSLEVAFALQILFDQVPHQLFPGLFEIAQDKLMRRAADMLFDLEGRRDRRSLAKRELLESLPHRADNEIAS